MHVGPADFTNTKSELGEDYVHKTQYLGPAGGTSTETINNPNEYKYLYRYIGPKGKTHETVYSRKKASLLQKKADPKASVVVSPGSETITVAGGDPYKYDYMHVGPADFTNTKSELGEDYVHKTQYLGPAGGTSTETINNPNEYKYIYRYIGPK